MIRRIIMSFSLFFSVGLVAQRNSSSPYSFYGIGSHKFKGTFENRSMGGVGILPDSIKLNLQNPATYAALKRTAFTMGASSSSVQLKTTENSSKDQTLTIDYLAVGIPMGKLAVAFGLMPFTAVGYKIQNNSGGAMDYRLYTGEGGVNRVFAGLGYQITKNFTIGADFDYNFGVIKTNRTVFKSNVQYGTRELNVSNLTGLSFNFGAVYQAKFTKKYDFTGSIVFSPDSKLKSQNATSIATITYNPSGMQIVQDQTEDVISEKNLTLPNNLVLGVGLGEKMKWFLGVEVTLEQKSKFSNLYDDILSASYEDGTKIAIGGYYIPNHNSFISYWDKVTYRSGLRLEKTGLIIADQSINDYALSLGVGLPLGRNYSSVNIGFEYGIFGTTKANLVQENYFNILVSLSISDKWFVRSKYD